MLRHNPFKKDPSSSFHFAALLQSCRDSSKQKVLFVNHHSGGGIERHISELAAALGDKIEVVTIRPMDSKRLILRMGTPLQGAGLRFSLPRHYHELLKLCRYLRISRVHFHHLMGIHPMIRNLPKDLEIHYDVTLHDFHLIHSNPTLTDQHGRYCQDVMERDDSCPGWPSTPGRLPEAPRCEGRADFLRSAERVFIPSEFAARLFLKHFSDLTPIVTWHPDWENDAPYPNPRPIGLSEETSLRVASIGMLSREKGVDLFESCAKQAKQRQLPLEFHLIGYALRPMSRFIKVHGRYEDRELGRLISEIDPHVIWFPAQWPETYSYTLSAALVSGRPLVVPDIGAFKERVKGRPFTRVESWDQPTDQWLKVFLELRDKMQEFGNRGHERIWADQHKQNRGFSYLSDYVVETPYSPEQDTGSFVPNTAWLNPFMCRNPGDVKEMILRAMMRFIRFRCVAYLVELLPYNRRRQIKRYFSRKPVHEIMR